MAAYPPMADVLSNASMYDYRQTWIRSVTNFKEIIERNGVQVQRFKPITEEDAIASIPFNKRRSLGIMRVFNGIERPDFTPDNITELRNDEVFVFGSNLEDVFLGYAQQHSDLFFYVTRIGCGIPGFKDKEIAPLFSAARDIENICLPKSFLEHIN